MTRATAIPLGYTVLVLGTTVVVLATGDESLAGVWLIVVTLPVSLLLQLLPIKGVGLALVLAAGGLAQAGLLHLALRMLAHRSQRA
ncbi:hypothetical protein SAMN05421810_101364 [Amycolatopsis arida]|uniref:Uncharacterized protein n=1 Tax=Amycolatopsis arida TaxID=587909 RepID=A0A1I5L1G4_9PSEU|nr:hypothetical protein [Amycolatopsis arida]TDX85908.1 hypothetical protein CLV69_11489 [Amycolatopsis arida]SFO91023.1 hypothetical protein SAMN05421810_101364 [Amycolatopsis arida]